MAGLSIRSDMSAEELRACAASEADPRVCRRMLAIANALDGLDRASAAERAGMERQALRDAVRRYNAQGLEGLRDRPRSGRPPKLDPGRQAALKAEVLRGPDPEKDGLSRYRAVDLCDLVDKRSGVRYSESGILNLLHGLDLSWRKARPRHPLADPKAREEFKKRA